MTPVTLACAGALAELGPDDEGHTRRLADAVHATESVDFLPGYLNRRINITMLFGYR
jgi:hypothetical protein